MRMLPASQGRSGRSAIPSGAMHWRHAAASTCSCGPVVSMWNRLSWDWMESSVAWSGPSPVGRRRGGSPSLTSAVARSKHAYHWSLNSGLAFSYSPPPPAASTSASMRYWGLGAFRYPYWAANSSLKRRPTPSGAVVRGRGAVES